MVEADVASRGCHPCDRSPRLPVFSPFPSTKERWDYMALFAFKS